MYFSLSLSDFELNLQDCLDAWRGVADARGQASGTLASKGSCRSKAGPEDMSAKSLKCHSDNQELALLKPFQSH